jgi:hypothetical protein
MPFRCSVDTDTDAALACFARHEPIVPNAPPNTPQPMTFESRTLKYNAIDSKFRGEVGAGA